MRSTVIDVAQSEESEGSKEMRSRAILAATRVFFAVVAIGATAVVHAQPRAINGSGTIETTSQDSVIHLEELQIPQGEVVQIKQPADSSKLLLRVDGPVIVDGALEWNGSLCIVG